MKKNQKNPKVKPLPFIPAIPPSTPEISPQPDKNKPEHPLPEITPSLIPEIEPLRKQNKY